MQTKIEEYTVDPEQGFVFFALGISKKGYKVKKIERKGSKAKVTYEKE